MTDADITTVNKNDRFEIHVDGQRAGRADYVDTDGQRIFHHTKVDDEFAGQGLAGKLIAAALQKTRAAGKRVVPVCSFVASYLDKHDEYRDIVDPVTEQARAAVEADAG
ncbi:GNAT family N-acetyltransferase [Mycobacterium sp. 1274756.6]|uniref:GNAT family N-acetyltransferase n=1 Tax=Mycobacterium sp. 1274756.6 TaxID=1834076 RepID=UPI0007FDD5D4|nr:GNAT family N-acetyltransferase [Mycobacterium sp. 1274756.6]OBJ73825.1 GNAT family acetyltransferase [Mycobacterium sp. 1274756.6]